MCAVLPGQQQATYKTETSPALSLDLKSRVKHLKEIQAGSLFKKKKVFLCWLAPCTHSSFQLSKAAAES